MGKAGTQLNLQKPYPTQSEELMTVNSYRSILKGTSLFGGVQIVQILLNLVRGKFVAMLLGPEGMGISSLFSTSSGALQRVASLGLNLALVKELAAASADGDRLKTVLSAARSLIMATAIFGALICVVFAPWLSRVTFGNDSMRWQFVAMAVAVAFGVAFSGNVSLLQGLGRLRSISVCSIAGGVAGLAIGVPLYWKYSIGGIVPAMGAMAAVMWLFSHMEVRKAAGKKTGGFSLLANRRLIVRLVSLGILLMANELILSLVRYAVNIFVNETGSTDDVGLYQAASSITTQYSGMVFAAMTMDFFPRLSRVAADNLALRDMVNRQNEITAIIIAPAVALLMLSSPLLIRILLTEEFFSVSPLMRWMGLGILFRALMIPMAYISFAKGRRKVFFWLEGIVLNALTLLLSCAFYAVCGLDGLGYAFAADNFLCLLIYYAVNRRLYGFRLDRQALSVMSAAIVAGTGVFAASLIDSVAWSYAIMSVLTTLTIVCSFLGIRRRIISESNRED